MTENAEEFGDVEELGSRGELARIFDSLSFDAPGEDRSERRRPSEDEERNTRTDDRRSRGDDSDLEPR